MQYRAFKITMQVFLIKVLKKYYFIFYYQIIWKCQKLFLPLIYQRVGYLPSVRESRLQHAHTPNI